MVVGLALVAAAARHPVCFGEEAAPRLRHPVSSCADPGRHGGAGVAAAAVVLLLQFGQFVPATSLPLSSVATTKVLPSCCCGRPRRQGADVSTTLQPLEHLRVWCRVCLIQSGRASRAAKCPFVLWSLAYSAPRTRMDLELNWLLSPIKPKHLASFSP